MLLFHKKYHLHKQTEEYKVVSIDQTDIHFLRNFHLYASRSKYLTPEFSSLKKDYITREKNLLIMLFFLGELIVIADHVPFQKHVEILAK